MKLLTLALLALAAVATISAVHADDESVDDYDEGAGFDDADTADAAEFDGGAADAAADDADDAADDDDEEPEKDPSEYAAPAPDASVSFLETFQSDPFADGRWVKSGDAKYAQQSWDWATTYRDNRPGINGDAGLVATTGARHYGIASKLDSPLRGDNTDGGGGHLVVQYEVRLHDGLDCGGAYLKLLDAGKLGDLGALDNESPYSIMFGPDKCGGTNKVHFIFRFTNPVTGETEEKHMQSTVRVPAGDNTHLYTLAISRADNTFSVSVDGVEKQAGSLLSASDVSPALIPPKVIDDPDDKKPSDWVDDAKMADPEASKPDDWDEDAPAQILDMSVDKPEGWEDDEPEFVADPEAVKPDDWDDEDDGEWEAPEVENPKCAVGCGAWERPMVANPDFKGKWSAPMIDNPEYKGEWAPEQIDNEAFFEDDDPVASFLPIGAVAVEIWTMSGGIHFDNIYLGSDPAAAKAFADATWAVKNPAEKAQAAAAKAAAKRKQRLAALNSGTVSGYFSYYAGGLMDLMGDNLVATILALSLGFGGLLWFCCIRDDGTYEMPAAREPGSSGEEADDDDSADAGADDDDAEEEEEEESGGGGGGGDSKEEPKVRKRKGRKLDEDMD